jgi:hypothetical protein
MKDSGRAHCSSWRFVAQYFPFCFSIWEKRIEQSIFPDLPVWRLEQDMTPLGGNVRLEKVKH